MFVSETRIHVRYAETDRMGIAHHSNYAVWFEEARTEFMAGLGYSYGRVEDEGVLLPLTDLCCSFKKPARYEQTLVVRVKVVRATCVRLRFHYEVVDAADNALVATGTTDHAWTDRALRPVNIMKLRPDIYRALTGCMREEA